MEQEVELRLSEQTAQTWLKAEGNIAAKSEHEINNCMIELIKHEIKIRNDKCIAKHLEMENPNAFATALSYSALLPTVQN